jgi:hypothetical protein
VCVYVCVCLWSHVGIHCNVCDAARVRVFVYSVRPSWKRVCVCLCGGHIAGEHQTGNVTCGLSIRNRDVYVAHAFISQAARW